MSNWTMIWGALGGLLTGAAAMLGAWESSRRRKRKDDQIRETALIEAQSKQREAYSEMGRQFNEQLYEPIKKELAELRARLKLAEDKIDHLEDTNDHLVAFIYKLVGLARSHGYDTEILPADVPSGIHL